MGRTITLLTTDRLTSRMFVEYYTAIHSAGVRPLTVSPSLYNSVDVAVSQINDARKALGAGPDLLVLYTVPDRFDCSNTPKEILDASDLVFMSDPKRSGESCQVVKSDPPELADLVVSRFSSNLSRMAVEVHDSKKR